MFQSTIVTAFEFVCFSRLPGSDLVEVSSFLVLLRALQRYGSGSPAPVSAGTQDLAAKSARAGRRSKFGVVRPLSNSDEPLLLLPAVFPLTRWLWPAAFPAEASHAALLFPTAVLVFMVAGAAPAMVAAPMLGPSTPDLLRRSCLGMGGRNICERPVFGGRPVYSRAVLPM